MLRYTVVAAVLLCTLPAVASAGRGYDRGGHHHGGSKSRFDISFGFGGGGYSDYSYVNFGYSRGYGGGYGHGRGYGYYPSYRSYCPPPVVYYPVRHYYKPYYRPYYRGGYCR